MVFHDDDEPVKSVNFTVGDDLTKFSVDELAELIRVLDAEKQRASEEMDRKKKSIEGAQSIFK